jgi:uroporphyrin-3 C-methyltransferase
VNSTDHDAEFDPFARENGKKKSGGSGGGLAFLALLIAIGAIGFNAYDWWQGRSEGNEDRSRQMAVDDLRQAQTDFNRSLESLQNRLAVAEQRDDTVSVTAINSDISALQSRLSQLALDSSGDQALVEAIQISLSDMGQRISDIETSVAALAVRGDTPGKRMDLAEIDYLLRMAGERIALFGDTDSADQALALADAQLEALDDPLYLPVRRRISESRSQLEQVPVPDVVQISGKIENLQSSITELPFPGEAPTEVLIEDQTDVGLWQKVKNSLKPLVTVRRRVDESQVLSLEDKDFLRQGLWLQLESARLALMRNDSTAWNLSLSRAKDSVSSRFDAGSRAVIGAMSDLEELEAINLDLQLPDVSAPWRQLRLLREGKVPEQPDTPPVSEAAQVDEAPETETVETDGDSAG